ncbi:glycosidase [Longilinea arvoryzae]|uniref:Glycosidase n=1 Tax=Longilinea arvoryzae TaxID=360412 RepID=A0A0S7BJ15_9CHLR|nr:alpha-amylase family glycosyl hydrolase [Longilinea arvoryzae]GAP14454.1 glycosidase [Longilinea arvoryzae]
MLEFHVSRLARDRYQFDQALFSFNGSVILANFHAARTFAQKINQKRDLVTFPESAVKAGQINAMGLIDEILHLVVHLYREQKSTQVMNLSLAQLDEQFGPAEVDRTLLHFITDFPPVAVYQGQFSPKEYLGGETDGVSHREEALEEMLMLWIANQNPALEPFVELFSDKDLAANTGYTKIMDALHTLFDQQPPFGPGQQNLIDMLRAPAVAVPYSLSGQLEFIREHWSELLGKYLYRLLSSLDLIKEENRPIFAGGGPGPTVIPVYDRTTYAGEIEAFSPDKEWMPRLVLMAKNTFVWLDQLSRKYQSPIQHLDQIPDAELEMLARAGFTGLWLIGLWERSKASATVKQLCGNPDAIASAYSLADYRIADELGGEAAYQNLRDRAWRYGIRLASDMVPNHMAIDSTWVIDHPDWFVQLDYCPYPSYTFNSQDLSPDGRVSVMVEDHYYNRTDAAVVFKYYDHRNGQTHYIYHGNDGTSMPWNDTAQLNYLKSEVREAVIQTILEVARRFPIIRFDAAMTLAKKHYERLWYPEPGSGGAIPSRAEHALTKAEFEAAFPVEFWREVVDRVAQEVPDTLLLAEAFWLMEGYFVRTLGMHRVYNSAFMNMLRNEDNAGYRTLIKNTLEFDPEILKRYVNFMNNPDEKTAVEQFGKGDKYFGICTLMATLPGLPMFGHGQIEGFAEKYGMEFKRAYWDETPDPNLLERHQREIFPLLHRRAIFAGVDSFLLYDFFTPEGSVDENVYAYSNGLGRERALVVYNNRFDSSRGWIKTSTLLAIKTPSGERQLAQRSLAEGLDLHPAENTYVILQDQLTHLETIHPSLDIRVKGLYLQLNGYKVHVFMNIREVQDNEWHTYRQICSYLNGRGVPSVEEAMQELALQPVQAPFGQIANPGYFNYLMENRVSQRQPVVSPGLLNEAQQKLSNLLDGIGYLQHSDENRDEILAELSKGLEFILSLPELHNKPALKGKALQEAFEETRKDLDATPLESWFIMLGWAFTHNLGKLTGVEGFAEQSQSWFDEWKLGKTLADCAVALGMDKDNAWRLTATIQLMIGQQGWYERVGALTTRQILENWLNSTEIQQFLGINRFKEILWFNREAFDQLARWMNLLALLDTASNPKASTAELVETLIGCGEVIARLKAAAEVSDYRVTRLLEAA